MAHHLFGVILLSASKSLDVGSIPGIGMVEKNFFFFIYYDFVVLETFGEILVLGSIPGVVKDIFFIFFNLVVWGTVHT